MEKKRITESLEMPTLKAITGFMCRAGVIISALVILASCRATAGTTIAGNPVTLPVTLSTGTNAISALQFDLVLPVGVSTQTVTAGSSATSAQKQIATNMVGGNLRVLLQGNQTAIPSGPVVLITLQLAANMPTATFQMTLINVVASDPAGASVPLGSTVPGVLSVTANVLPVLSVGSN